VARLSQIFAPKDRVFFDLFEEAAANALRAAELLDEMLRSFPEHNDLARAILLCEQEGDRITYDMIQRLNATFVTPIDREDIYDLAKALDDICDFMDQVADEVNLYGVEYVPPEAIEQAGVIHRAVLRLAEGIQGLDGLRDVSDHLIAVHTLEDEGDRIVRDAVAKLFSNGQDPMAVIRWKDIYQDLEQAVDGCETAAHVLESVYLKNR
jgi:predicted phosphate transport protein (TIGR00153 family)